MFSLWYFSCYVFPVSHFTMSSLWKRGNKQLAQGTTFHIAVTGHAARAARARLLHSLYWCYDSVAPVVSVGTSSSHVFTLQRHVVFITYAAGAQSLVKIPVMITKKNLLSTQDLHSCTPFLPHTSHLYNTWKITEITKRPLLSGISPSLQNINLVCWHRWTIGHEDHPQTPDEKTNIKKNNNEQCWARG